MSETRSIINRILLEELNNIINKVNNHNIEFIDNVMSYCKFTINGKDYYMSYDKYVHIMTHRLPNFHYDNVFIQINENYDNYITQKLYNMYNKNSNDCKSYKMTITVEEDNKQYEIYYTRKISRGILISSKNKYSCNDRDILNYLMNDIYYCKSNIFIINLTVKNNYLLKLKGRGNHRNIMLLHKKETNKSIYFQIYIYEPHGTDIKKSKIPQHILDNFVKELNRNTKKFRNNHDEDRDIIFSLIDKTEISCPRGLQSYAKKYDIGMCVYFSHFWYYMLFMCMINKNLNKDFDIVDLITVLETDFIKTINNIAKNEEGQQLLYKLMVRFSYYNMQEYLHNYYNSKQRTEIENRLNNYIIENYIDNNNVIR
uniref:Uncharacterized protein n=1 Tax=viral metagenome TaxID=1070528 RepID=A0A6C0I595_9ZZZZ